MKWSSLISEEAIGQSKASIGRVSFWIVLAILCFMWLSQWEIPDTLFWTWTILVGYNLAKKPLDTLDTYMNLKKLKEEQATLDNFFDK